VAGTHIKNGGLQNTSSGYSVGTERILEVAGTTEEKLDGIVRGDLKDIGTTWEWMKPKNWRQTEQSGVNARPSASMHLKTGCGMN